MKIVMLHNFYQFSGGEDRCFHDEADLLEAHGHQVVRFTAHNKSIRTQAPLAVALRTLWSLQTYRRLRRVLRTTRPDIMHGHNLFPLLSPSVYDAASVEGIPVVQTLHNYRLLCPGATLFREERVCEDCLRHPIFFPAVRHRCYRNSTAGSAAVSAMLLLHRALRTWRKKVALYIALTKFSRRKFLESGFPPESIVTKPNFLACDPGLGQGEGKFALFVGRLSPEKGIAPLLKAWRSLKTTFPLRIVGAGPLEEQVRQEARRNPAIQWLGHRPLQSVLNLLGQARFLIFPSLWYECLPRTLIEAFAKGTPVLASDLGAMAELVRHRKTGLFFRPGDPTALAATVDWALRHPAELTAMRHAARAEYEAKYTSEKNHSRLIQIYQAAIAKNRIGGQSRLL